jgi:hypothetical protein
VMVPTVAVGTDRTGRLWKHLGPVCSETSSWPRIVAGLPETRKTHSRPLKQYLPEPASSRGVHLVLSSKGLTP